MLLMYITFLDLVLCQCNLTAKDGFSARYEQDLNLLDGIMYIKATTFIF